MRTYPITLLQLGILTGTRAVAGAGLALLLLNRASPEQRKAVGWSFLGVGSVIYLVLCADLILRNRDGSAASPAPGSSGTV